MNIPKSFKGVPIVVFVCILISCILVAYAVTSWTHTIPWDIADPQFQVYNATTGSIIPTSVSSPTFTSSPHSESYNITNTGNVDIYITITETLTSGSAVWDITFPYRLNIGQSIIATVTLTVSGTGSYVFTFGYSLA